MLFRWYCGTLGDIHKEWEYESLTATCPERNIHAAGLADPKYKINMMKGCAGCLKLR
jgi:hypothetical protein